MKNILKAVKILIVFVALFAVACPAQQAVADQPISVPVTSPSNRFEAERVVHADVDKTLEDFVANIENGNGNQIVGIYTSDLFELPVVQQPSGYAGYVSTASETATQFSMASNYGSIGILAHNYLAGQYFFNLSSGDEIALVYGDGTIKDYTVSEVRAYQALSPSSPYSSFINVYDPSTTLSSSDLFYETYGHSGALVLQTCIDNNGVSSWGRLFVIAYETEA